MSKHLFVFSACRTCGGDAEWDALQGDMQACGESRIILAEFASPATATATSLPAWTSTFAAMLRSRFLSGASFGVARSVIKFRGS